MALTNALVASHSFLRSMYRDRYLPNFLVDKIKGILVDVCIQIESKSPQGEMELLEITHPAVEKINGLAQEFADHGSNLDTCGSDAMGEDFFLIVRAYGFEEVDIEDVISPRNW